MADSDKQSELQQQSRNLVDFILAGEQSQADKLRVIIHEAMQRLQRRLANVMHPS